MRLPLGVLVAAVPLVALVLGGPVALREQGLGAGVPDLQTLADVMQGSATGLGRAALHAALRRRRRPAGAGALPPRLPGRRHGRRPGCSAPAAPGCPVLPLLAVLVAVLLLRRPEGGAPRLVPGGVRRAGHRLGRRPGPGVRARRRSGSGAPAGAADPRADGRVWWSPSAFLVAVPLTSSSAPSDGRQPAGHGARRCPTSRAWTPRCVASAPSPSRSRGRPENVYRRRAVHASRVCLPEAGSGC